MSASVLNHIATDQSTPDEPAQAVLSKPTSIPASFPVDVPRQRAINLFCYLMAIDKLRMRVVRDCDSYESLFWICDLPREQECSTLAWGDSEENEEGTWLRIERPLKPCPPHPPAVCEPWIDCDQLEDAARQPVLLDEITDPAWPVSNADPHGQQDEENSPRLRLADHPEVLEAWQSYVENEWICWSDSCQRWARVQEAYRQLFSIYQTQRRRGEQFELVLGIGTLTWLTDSGDRVHRPIITARAVIALDPDSGTITVLAAEGPNLRLEQDMLEVNERPPVVNQQEVERSLAGLDTPWDRLRVFETLRSWTHSLPCAGAAFSESIICTDHATKDPQIAFAPVLMLRKRSNQTLHTTLQKMLTQLKNGIQLPAGIREICGDYGIARNDEIGEHAGHTPSIPDELLFPLPSNQEQQDIIGRLAGRPGIVVQGPPGTGKTHTIANVISHYLAHDKRILVTSQTPRALKALHAKIPAPLQSLCVSLLGNDAESLRNMEKCVQGILRTTRDWDPLASCREIKEITHQRRSCLSDLARFRQMEQLAREAETIQHLIPGTPYLGTAQTIAQQVTQQQEQFAWLTDDPQENACFPLSTVELEELVELSDHSDFGLLESELPDTQCLPSPRVFAQAITACRVAEKAALPFDNRSNHPGVLGLSQLVESDLSSLKATATHNAKLLERLMQHAEPWLTAALNEILSGNQSAWTKLFKSTNAALESLQAHGNDVEPTQFCLPPAVTQDQLLADASELLNHLQQRGGLGFPCFRPAVVRCTQYLWKKYRFAGRLCNNIAVIQSLVTYLERLNIIARSWLEWSKVGVTNEGNVPQSMERLEGCQCLLKAVLDLRGVAAETEKLIANNGIVGRQLIGPEWAESLLADLDAASAIRNRHAAKQQLDRTTAPILAIENLTNLHSAVLALVAAAQSQDPQAYGDSLREVESLASRRTTAARCLELDQRLCKVAPQLADEIRNPVAREEIGACVSSIQEAWAWRKAKRWLDRFVSDNESDAVAEKIKSLECQITGLTERLVTLRAWQSCSEELRADYEKQGALQAWQQMIRKFGRGTGVHAETYRRDAQKYMNKCRDAIPVWIMPLHRVVEITDVQAEAFDIVIVDEASQTGPEGLLLQFLGKQCIIVGDDKQISPEAVGVNQSAVRGLMEQYLGGFPFAETLNPSLSLFDQALVRYGGNRVTLQEHFRCMPEIIRFSNDLCYQDTPLISLRECPPDRLPPIVVKHVIDGYKEGTARAVVNRPEAAAVAKTVIDCLNDPRYAGKSMGVICLQGDVQSQVIEQMILEAVGPAPFQERQLMCGDPYSFQGDERDVIFLSMVTATQGDRRGTPLVRETFQQRYNVAVSRAKDQLWLFHSVLVNDLHPDCMRRRLLEHCYNPRTQALAQDLAVCRSDFERDVAEELIRRDFRVIPAYVSAGKEIDLVVEGTTSRLAIECDDHHWHGPDRYAADMVRQRGLERCGWKFTRVRSSAFYSNRQREISRLLADIHGRGIEPIAGAGRDGSGRTWVSEVSGRECLESFERHQVSNVDETNLAVPSQDAKVRDAISSSTPVSLA